MAHSHCTKTGTEQVEGTGLAQYETMALVPFQVLVQCEQFCTTHCSQSHSWSLPQSRWNVFQSPLPSSPPPRGIWNQKLLYWVWFQSPPPLVMVNQIVVPVMVTHCKGWQNLQVLSSLLQLVVQLLQSVTKLYRWCPVCTYVSFVTNCKTFRHQL